MDKKSLKGTRTEHNLLAAFAGESQARTRYTLFAEKAREESYEQIAAVFEETARQELSHARMFFNRLEGGQVTVNGAAYPAGTVGDTLTNLREARDGEHEEWGALYASFGETAREEGFNDVAALFKLVSKAEQMHEARYETLVKRLESETEFRSADGEEEEWYCRECGYVHRGTAAPGRCPLCGKPQGYFERKARNY